MNGFFPMYQRGVFDYPMAMTLATIIGIGFGFALERAGFGRARILVAQFYGTDNRMLKVMFTAVATAALGLGVLGGLGWVDLTAIQIPTTWIGPQIVGSLVLGAGFVISGYCPGTAVVASASGNLDGVASLVGIMLGSLLFGFAYPALESFYMSGGMGTQQLHTMLGVPWAVVALAVAAIAAGAFFAGEWLEKTIARKHGTEPPQEDPRVRNRVLVGLGAAGLAGLVTMGLTPTIAAPAPTPLAQITPMALADQLITDATGVFVVDLRSEAECTAKRIPGALCLPAEDTAGFFASLPTTRELVVYAAGDVADVPADIGGFKGKTRVLEGGYAAFVATALTKPAPPTEGTPAALAAWEKANATFAFFSGVKAAPPPKMPTRKVIKRAARKGGGC